MLRLSAKSLGRFSSRSSKISTNLQSFTKKNPATFATHFRCFSASSSVNTDKANVTDIATPVPNVPDVSLPVIPDVSLVDGSVLDGVVTATNGKVLISLHM
jgi:hypothetical protein